MRITHNYANLAIFGALSLPCSAQNETDEPDLRRCRGFGTLSPDAHVNSTGSLSFRWPQQTQDWYLTTTFNDTRSPILLGGIQDLVTWLSAPEETDNSICIYMLQGINATGTGDNGCEGILSQSCVRWLTDNIPYNNWNDGSRERCALFPPRDELQANCGDHVSSYASTGVPLDLSNNTCAISSPPGNDMPDGYKTHQAFGIGMLPQKADRFVDDFDFYDIYVRQTRPWVITTAFNASKGRSHQTRVLCQAPDRVLGESRQPEGPWPPENAGNHIVSFGAVLPLLITGIVGWALIL
ncbi:hypothetical protein DE146DRAFT_630906 [Phaeosphaeria sp. MPI-PUGE-AT-0046c]|nr:hypothetical protein DE146DRAFT_630906 [Phaeosphaeria sp. MPI-PUGE-AT-0046c]